MVLLDIYSVNLGCHIFLEVCHLNTDNMLACSYVSWTLERKAIFLDSLECPVDDIIDEYLNL